MPVAAGVLEHDLDAVNEAGAMRLAPGGAIGLVIPVAMPVPKQVPESDHNVCSHIEGRTAVWAQCNMKNGTGDVCWWGYEHEFVAVTDRLAVT